MNDVRFGYTRDYYSYLNPDNGTAIDTELGIPNGNRNALLGGISLIGDNNTQLSYTGDGGQYSVPQYTYEVNDGVSFVHGAHNFKFGADIIHREVDFFQAAYSAKGFFNHVQRRLHRLRYLRTGRRFRQQLRHLQSRFFPDYLLGDWLLRSGRLEE